MEISRTGTHVHENTTARWHALDVEGCNEHTGPPVNVVVSGEIKTTSTSSSAPSESNVVVRVPEDCNTLEEAVKKVHDDNSLTTIVLGKGEHKIDGDYLLVYSAMNIVGDPGAALPKQSLKDLWWQDKCAARPHT